MTSAIEGMMLKLLYARRQFKVVSQPGNRREADASPHVPPNSPRCDAAMLTLRCRPRRK
jgi:hypothetical protein